MSARGNLTQRERNWLGDQGQAHIEAKFDALRDALVRIVEYDPYGGTNVTASRVWTSEREAMRAIARAALTGEPE